MHLRMHNSILGFYSLGANTTLTSSCDNHKCLQDFQMFLGGTFENHCSLGYILSLATLETAIRSRKKDVMRVGCCTLAYLKPRVGGSPVRTKERPRDSDGDINLLGELI